MLAVSGASAVTGPWLGVWERVVDSPDAGIALAAVLFTMATTGIALAVFGSRPREEPVETVPVVVQARRRPRRVRRRR